MTLQQLFQQALTYYQQGSYAEAARMLTGITAAAPKHPAGWHLLALTLRKQGQLEQSERCFDIAVKLTPNDADMLNNFANLKRQQLKLDGAERLFRRAIQLKPALIDAWYNLGLLLSGQKRHKGAIQCLRQVLQLQPRHKSAFLALAYEYMHSSMLIDAAELLQRALSEPDADVDLCVLYAELLRKQGDYTQAIAQLLPLQQHATAIKELALCYFAMGHTEQAKDIIARQLEVTPTDPTWLHLSAELGWQSSDPAWLSAYQTAIAQKDVSPLVFLEYANKLQKAGDAVTAEKVVDLGLSHADGNSGLLLLKGYLRREAGDFTGSLNWLSQAQNGSTQASEAFSEQVISLLALDRVDAAIALAKDLCSAKPLDQAYWALLAACYKQAQDDKRYRQLYDFDNFIAAFELAAPNGYSDIAEFNQQLLSTLHSLHISNQHPLQQSLRQGTQTEDHLFYRQDIILQQLQQQISAAVSEYIAQLPNNKAHPFLQRKAEQFRYSGAWSVRLRQQGFHRNHYHGDGWISGCYYVSVPAAVNQSGNGWIKFGQPEMGRHFTHQPDYLVKPQAGLLVLFPSMMWHGTVPFDDEQYRVTVAFDIVPQSHEEEL